MGNRDDGGDALRELEARYWAMVEHAPEAIVVFDLDSQRFSEVNEQACRMFGMERAQLLCEGPISLSPPRQPDGTPSEQGALEFIARTMAGEVPTFEWTHLDSDGREIPCRIQLARLPSEEKRLVRGSIVDITEQMESERARHRLEAIIEATTDIVGTADLKGRVLFINQAGRRQLEIADDDDIVGRSLVQLHTRASAKRIMEEGVPAAIRDGVWRGETEFVTRSGRVIPTSQLILAHKSDRGDMEYLSTIARDMTVQKDAQQVHRKMLHGQKLESLGVLAGGIAHDFNNILVGILGNAALMLRRLPATSDVAPLAKDIERAAVRASDLAQQMLAYVGKAQVEEKEVHVERLVRDVSRLVEASIAKTARLVFDFGPDVPPIVGDPAQLRQVLMNLIINASDALGDEPGEVSVRTSIGPLDRSTLVHDHLPRDVGPVVMIEVRDSGAGMSSEVLERVFDPFYTTKFTGRGLGLAAVLGIIRSHDGGIRVDSEPGDGTRFCVYFAPVADEWDEPEPTGAGSADAQWHGRGTILVVDDEAMVRRVVCAVLGDLGFDAIEAANGADGVRLFAENLERIVAVVLDLTMPEMSGAQVLERLREIRPEVPVLLASGYAEPVDGLRAEGFLHKPFTLDQFEAALRALLGDETRS